MLESRSVTLSPLSPAAAIQVQITPRTGEVSIGDSKLFLCQVVGEASEIDWYSPSGEKILPDRDDFSVSRNDEATSLLIIYKATESSAGIYKCVARSEDKEAQATVELTIFQRITFSNAPSRQEFNEGDNALILCNVVSSPAPQILWKYKGTRIYSNQDVRFSHVPNGLQIRGIKKNDEGMYTCEARVLTRGEIDFRMIEVVVNVLPTIRARQSDINATAEVGNSVMLACDADGFPEPMVTWVHNNVVLESGDKYSLNEDGSELLIKDVKKVDEGDYTCMAKNKAGEKSEEVSLNVFVQPTITYLSNQTASEFDEQVTLTCEASGDPTPTISWSFENRVFTEGEQASWTRPDKYESLDRNIVVLSHARLSSLTLKNVQFTYAGQYLCSAANAIGQDSRAVHLEVRYAPKVLGSVVVYTWEGNPANISCEVKAHPGASVLWFRDGLPLPSANSSNIKIYHTPTTSYLEVNPNSQTDFGSYNCTATNVMGTESKEFLLISADVPSPPEIEAVRPFSSTAVVEFAEPASTGGVPVLRYKVEWRLPSSPDWTSAEYKPGDADAKLTIGGLKPETVYEVKMSAINGKGQGDSSPSTPFKTEPVRFSGTNKSPFHRSNALPGLLRVDVAASLALLRSQKQHSCDRCTVITAAVECVAVCWRQQAQRLCALMTLSGNKNCKYPDLRYPGLIWRPSSGGPVLGGCNLCVYFLFYAATHSNHRITIATSVLPLNLTNQELVPDSIAEAASRRCLALTSRLQVKRSTQT
ncbi:neural cell adhesion molecule 1a isoform X5 [Nelusetta ayraudi]|uniref:neural cell adhesion molecule 1a isoform X5 n=1 Tax=Nelusetta ayraudi TaxID=303726 RepID=UPI003F72FA16